MAEGAYTTPRRSASPLIAEGHPPTRRDSSPGAHHRATGAFLLAETGVQILDVTTHPDRDLLQACARMAHLQERWDQPGATLDFRLSREFWQTAEQIAAAVPLTDEGLRMKAMVGLDLAGLNMPHGHISAPPAQISTAALGPWSIAAGVMRDVALRGAA